MSLKYVLQRNMRHIDADVVDGIDTDVIVDKKQQLHI